MIIKYFSEIKNRAILIAFSWVLTLTFSYLNKETLLFLSIKPNIDSFKDTAFYFIATNVTDIFTVYLSLTYLVSFQLTSVYCLHQFKDFIVPALYKTEHFNLIFFFKLSVCLWVIGLGVLHKVMLPFCWEFFSSFINPNKPGIAIFLEIKITEYLSLYIFLYYTTFILSQASIFVFLLLNIVKKKLLFIKNTRKLFYFSFFLIATLITPPDVTNQLFLGTIFIIIYELVIIVIIRKDLYLVREPIKAYKKSNCKK